MYRSLDIFCKQTKTDIFLGQLVRRRVKKISVSGPEGPAPILPEGLRDWDWWLGSTPTNPAIIWILVIQKGTKKTNQDSLCL